MDPNADDEIRQELRLIGGIKAQVGGLPAHHAEPVSDLAADENRFPNIWAASVARRSLSHGIENFEAACALMLNGSWVSPQFALLRASYESAGSAVWLLESENIDTRLARLIKQHTES